MAIMPGAGVGAPRPSSAQQIGMTLNQGAANKAISPIPTAATVPRRGTGNVTVSPGLPSMSPIGGGSSGGGSSGGGGKFGGGGGGVRTGKGTPPEVRAPKAADWTPSPQPQDTMPAKPMTDEQKDLFRNAAPTMENPRDPKAANWVPSYTDSPQNSVTAPNVKIHPRLDMEGVAKKQGFSLERLATPVTGQLAGAAGEIRERVTHPGGETPNLSPTRPISGSAWSPGGQEPEAPDLRDLAQPERVSNIIERGVDVTYSSGDGRTHRVPEDVFATTGFSAGQVRGGNSSSMNYTSEQFIGEGSKVKQISKYGGTVTDKDSHVKYEQEVLTRDGMRR